MNEKFCSRYRRVRRASKVGYKIIMGQKLEQIDLRMMGVYELEVRSSTQVKICVPMSWYSTEAYKNL